MMWPIVQVWSMPKLKLNYWDLFNRVRSMMKAKQDNDMTDGIDAIYDKNEPQLL